MDVLEKAQLWSQWKGSGGMNIGRAQKIFRAVKLFCVTLCGGYVSL